MQRVSRISPSHGRCLSASSLPRPTPPTALPTNQRSVEPMGSLSTSRRPLMKLLGLAGLAAAGLGGGRSVAAAATSYPATPEEALADPQWPETWPFTEENFQRYDESSDASFYSIPRFVTHIDDAAISALTDYYSAEFPPSGTQDAAILDICSSWISHYPPGYTAGRISGLGMNEEELARNSTLNDFTVKDLNVDPTLPYPDNSFDFVTNAVSVDYLTRPLEVFTEMHRVLKPGGKAIMSFSNRCFPTKAISLWTATGDLDHVWIVGAYFHYSGFEAPQAKDITKKNLLGQKGDPMYVVTGRKAA